MLRTVFLYESKSVSDLDQVIQRNIIILGKLNRAGEREFPDSLFVSAIDFPFAAQNICDLFLCQVMVNS